MITPIDISTFEPLENTLPHTIYLVVKSQDQLERRARLLAKKKGGKYGRTSERPTAIGLLVKGRITNGTFEVEWQREFREPRHMCKDGKGNFLLSSMKHVHVVNSEGKTLHSSTNDIFAYLHTIRNHDNKLLVVSSGYDTILETDLSGKTLWQWTAWDHGFNPDEEGYYLTFSEEKKKEYEAQGKKSIVIDPQEYGEQGLVTARRTAHPSAAVYNPYNNNNSIMLIMAHDGSVYEIDHATKEKTQRLKLSQMPHGILPHNGGWCITDTITARFFTYTKDFEEKECFDFSKVPGKVESAGENEWIQQIIPFCDNYVIALDSNRGLVIADLTNKKYCVAQVNENWCIQDALVE